jgi:hypothetical protein
MLPSQQSALLIVFVSHRLYEVVEIDDRVTAFLPEAAGSGEVDRHGPMLRPWRTVAVPA